MNAKHDLVAAYDSWAQLTHTEGTAIRKNDWAGVQECQRRKLDLQKEIVHLTELARAETCAAGTDPQNFERDVRPIINRLIALEVRNSEWLAQERASNEAARVELEQSSQNLRRVQRSYASRSEAVWHSYS